MGILSSSPNRRGRSPPVVVGNCETAALTSGPQETGRVENDDESTGTHHPPSCTLCPLEDVAVVSAAMAKACLESFDRIAAGASGIFSSASGSKESRLAALLAFRTRSAVTRRRMLDERDMPAWARGRMPASTIPVSDAQDLLPSPLKQVVDSSLAAPRTNLGPGFGSWAAPSMVFDLEGGVASPN